MKRVGFCGERVFLVVSKLETTNRRSRSSRVKVILKLIVRLFGIVMGMGMFDKLEFGDMWCSPWEKASQSTGGRDGTGISLL